MDKVTAWLQDKKNLPIVIGVAVVLVVLLIFMLMSGRSRGPRQVATGQGGMMGGQGMMGAGGPGMMQGQGGMTPGMMGGAGMMGKGPGMMGAGGAGMQGAGGPGMMQGAGMMGAGGPGGMMKGPGMMGAGGAGMQGPGGPSMMQGMMGQQGGQMGMQQAMAPVVEKSKPPKEKIRANPFAPSEGFGMTVAQRIATEVPRQDWFRQRPSAAVAAGPPPVETLPNVRMAGLLWGDRVSAVLDWSGDMRVVRPGNQVDGWRVERIERNGMWLRQGNRRARVNLQASSSGVGGGMMGGGPGMMGAGGPGGPGGG